MKHIYPERESKTLEFKSRLPHFSQLIKTCIAFANAQGGQIIIGIDDKSREVIGIDEHTRNRIYDEFPNSLYDATLPCLLIEIYEKSFDDLSVIIIDVPYSIKKPVYIKSEGMEQGTYLRVGSSTRKATKEYLEELIRENKRESYDEEIIHEDIKILSPAILKNIYKKYSDAILIADKIIKKTSLQSNKYYPTIAGTLACCETPDQYIPEAIMICTKFEGTSASSRNIIQTEEIRGNLETLVENTYLLIKSWLIREYKLQGIKLKGKTIIPEEALRESIINAVIHRKYSIPGAIKIALYEDRLEIFNPGGFPGLMDMSQLGDGTTYLRNPNLARIARKCGLVEKLGTGIRLIFDSCRRAGLRKPDFIEGADSLKVVFSFLPSNDSSLSEEEKILALFKIKKEIELSDVELSLDVSRNTATRKLNLLIKSKKIERYGKGPAVRFRLKEDIR
ncbi:MAG TPA: ATP-binding protein [Gammaproteobacteria bacterium]|jgi:ATP-dependent DNA helicase RecG|nr:ATP-binding protein [Gammaproteobacteria bacterium]